LNPYLCKVDVEKVFDFLVNKIQIVGPIGVYGRSLGGIAATHLASKFPDIIKVIIADRTFCELE
jgi:pimeloyl-ACP methyl ester carboxylesterase